MMLNTKYPDSMPSGSRQEDCFTLSSYTPMNHYNAPAWGQTCCVAHIRDALGLFAVCDCGIS